MSPYQSNRRLRLVSAGLAGSLALTVAAGCAPTAYKITPVPADRSLQESTVLADRGILLPKIALIDVDGLITNSSKFSLLGEGEHPVSLFAEKLDKAADDDRVKALILRINSPGGTVTASDLMYREVVHFKRKTGNAKPVVAVLMDVAASGGYYVACSADRIVANPTTVTGSIGVIMQLVSVADTMAKIGITANTIKSGEMKDAGSPFRHMKPEEREVFQGLVDQFFDGFVAVVAAGRPGLDEAEVRRVADGRVYSAAQALELGFVDEIGTLRDAVDEIKTQIGAKQVRVVTYHRPLGYKPNIYAETPAQQPQLNLINVNLPDAWTHPLPRFLYLWAPEP